MEIKAIVEQYLISNGYDGLYSLYDCACKLDDLMPCLEIRSDCTAGYEMECDCKMGCNFHIGRGGGSNR